MMPRAVLGVFAVLCLVACGGGSSDDDMGSSADLAGTMVDDLSGMSVDLAGADLAGGCEPPTGTHYALGGGTTSALYKLGDNGWDAKLCNVVLEGTTSQIRLDSISAGSGGSLVANSARFIYSLSTTPNALGNCEAHDLSEYSTGARNFYDYTVVNRLSSTTYLAIYNESVYCLDSSKTYDVGAFVTAGYYDVTAVDGTCALTDNGAFDVTVVGGANGSSRVMHFTRVDNSAPAVLASQSSAIQEKLGGYSANRSVSDSGGIWSVSASGTPMKLRDTKLCVDAGNPFNGTKIGGLRGLVW